MICWSCQRIVSWLMPTRLCHGCIGEIRDEFLLSRKIDLPEFESGLVLYQYQDRLRQMILDAKASNRMGAVKQVLRLVIFHPHIYEMLNWCDAITPMPGSTWGKLRGKYDLVYFVSNKLAKKFTKPLIRLPVPWAWRLRKRSMSKTESPTRFDYIPESVVARYQARLNQTGVHKILLVDDVSTTGLTFRYMTPYFTGIKCKPLIIAGSNKLVEIGSG